MQRVAAAVRPVLLNPQGFCELPCSAEAYYDSSDTIPVRERIAMARNGPPKQVPLAEVAKWMSHKFGHRGFQACEAIRPDQLCKVYFDVEMVDSARVDATAEELDRWTR